MEKPHPEARRVVGFPDYMIDPNGNLWSQWIRGSHPQRKGPWRQLKLKVSRFGYVCCNLYRESNKPERVFVHRLLMAAFVGPCQDGMFVLHRDDNKTNNSLSNLYYGTRQQNSDDCIRNGRVSHGDKRWNAKLTNETVRRIKEMRKQGSSLKELSAMFGVSRHYITKICTGEIWKHV